MWKCCIFVFGTPWVGNNPNLCLCNTPMFPEVCFVQLKRYKSATKRVAACQVKFGKIAECCQPLLSSFITNKGLLTQYREIWFLFCYRFLKLNTKMSIPNINLYSITTAVKINHSILVNYIHHKTATRFNWNKLRVCYSQNNWFPNTILST